MTLASGTRLGPYEILAPLGAGGMGEVYRARDMRLGRSVAVKVLPERISFSRDSRERFEREAKTISQLAHPNICALYDVGEEGSVAYIVMEYLEGQTLADRLAKGALRLDQALLYAREIASALDAAHRGGIVHRDLKPGNVMLTRAGVKLLDFGLAKLLRPETGIEDLTSAPTEEKDLTLGAILGTLAYIAPEQLEGKTADARSDIWALGAVIYEMVTGRNAFSGSNQASLLLKVIAAEPPPISATLPAAPPALDRLIRVCLSKDPADRWQSAHDVGLELDGIREGGAPPLSVGQRHREPAWIPWLAAAVALAAAVGLVALLRPRAAAAPAVPVIRFSVPPPEGGNFSYSAESDFFSPSPDGSKLAYLAREKTGERRIFVRPLVSADQSALAGTDGAQSLFWSPDSRSLAFVAEDKLMRIDVAGFSRPVLICDVPRGFGMTGSWGSAGEILFANIQGDAIYRVPAAGGQPALVLKPDRSRGEFRTHWPWFLPDGRRYLYLSRGENNSATLKLAETGKQTRDLMPIQSFARYSDPGFLLFAREGALFAQRFDAETGRVRGEPFSIAPKVRAFRATGAASFATSANGVLALQTKQDVMRLVWLDRTGRELSTIGSPGRYGSVRICPDGKRALVDEIRDGIDTYDIWSLDLERGTQTAVTTDPGTEFGAVLLPDGKGIAFSMTRGRTPRLFRRNFAALKDEPMRPDNGRFQVALDVSRDGRFLLFGEQGETGTMDTWVYPLSGGGQPFPFIKSPYNKSDARFSPDGRYVAFISDDSGSPEAYVTPFPEPGERVRVSTAGALHLQWGRDGRELFYLSADRHMTAVAVQTSPSLHLGAPVPLFVWNGEIGKRGALERGTTSRVRGFDVSPDGQQFLAVVSEVIVDDLPLSVVVNWPAEIPH